MERLKGKVAIVTGGGTGIGEAICKKFALEGASVVVAGFPDDPVDAVAREIKKAKGTAIAFEGDLSVTQNAKNCVELAIQEFGKLDILINNAGIFPEVNFISDFSEEAFDALLRCNLKSAFLMTKMAIPYLQKTKGNIVFAGSEAGQLGIAQVAPYGGTKGFIHAFMKGVAAEQAQHGVRVNCVSPGAIDTAWTHRKTSDMDKKMEKMIVEATPMGRRGTPEEMANVYLFLASDEASFVTGSIYFADGGITISKGPMGSMADKSFRREPKGELRLKHKKEGATEIR